MTLETAHDLISQLDRLLEIEREALLAGDLEKLAQLLGRKEELIDALNTLEKGEARQLEILQSKVARNQALLDGAMRGIRMVAQRMNELRHNRRPAETYDKQGGKAPMSGTRINSLEKRA